MRLTDRRERAALRDRGLARLALHVVFGGSVPQEPHGRIERSMVESTPPEWRDRRDWDEIRAWARAIAAQLPTAEAHPSAA